MAIIFMREIQCLQESVLRQSIEVEDRLRRALVAVAQRDVALADAIEAGDEEIDRRELLIEEECLKLLALHQPVASDLRFLVGILKLNNDLERIGDLAVNIADRARRLAAVPYVGSEPTIDQMGVLVINMLRNVFQAFMEHNAGLAAAVVASDDEVDDLNRKMIASVVGRLRAGEPAPDALLLLLGVSRELERVGDHASNIAEDVIYMVEGAIVRHHGLDQKRVVDQRVGQATAASRMGASATARSS
jgi:phosphate transport system protein